MILPVIDLNKRTRVDLFVADHIDSLDSQLTSAVSKAIKRHENDEAASIDESQRIKVRQTNSNEMNISSQGMRSQKTNKDRNKNSILDPHMRSHINHHVPLLPNGSELQRRNKSFVLTDTCAYDSITSIYGTIYMDYSFMRNKIDNSTCKFAAFIKLLVQQKAIDSKIEFARFEFLKEVIPHAVKEMKNLVLFKCKTAISGLFSSMCKTNADILSSRRRIQRCSKCESETISESPFLNCNFENFDFKNVQKSIVAEKTRVCDTCLNKTMEIGENLYDIVAIDCESLNEIEQAPIAIKDIENRIQLKGDEYELLAAIEYDRNIEHFTAHIKRKLNNWETYDDLSRTINDTNISQEIFVFIIFYKIVSKGMYIKIHRCK